MFYQKNICNQFGFSQHEIDFFVREKAVTVHHWPTGKQRFCNTYWMLDQNKYAALKQLNDIINLESRRHVNGFNKIHK